MHNTCQHTMTTNKAISLNVNAYDPTRTTTLRNAFTRELNRRFKALTREIRKAIVDEDVFGLKAPKMLTFATPGTEAFKFATSQEKIDSFMAWLNGQVDRGILQTTRLNQIGVGAEKAWTNLYVQDSYKRGIIRARYELNKAGYGIPNVEATGGIGISMSTPFHIDRLGILYSRTFNELKGITAAMDSQISRVLAQGLGDGDGPSLLARKLVSTIDGTGMGKLGLTDSIGRFIPARRRAEIMARTEIIRAHHKATIQEYRNWGAEGVKVQAEFTTAGDERVCDICMGYHGNVYTLRVVENMIPVHPQCFIDPQIPIYTSKGWKPIGKIDVGDLVMTHKKRFRKVYGLPRGLERPVTVQITGDGFNLIATAAHPILINGKDWVPICDVKIRDIVSLYDEKRRIFKNKMIISITTNYFKTYTDTYNLSVEEDESYIAKGIVVHNCRCMALPTHKGVSAQAPGKVGEVETPKTKTPPTLKEVLSKKESSIRTLSHEEFYAFDKKGKRLLSATGDSNSVYILKSDLKKLNNSIITHNHPAGNKFKVGNMRRIGNSFGVQDIVTAVTNNAAEMRAVTPEFTFIARRKAASGEFWGVAPSDVRKAFMKADKEIEKIMWDRLDRGVTTVNKAMTIHWHLVNRRVARELGYEYIKFRI